MSISPLRSTSLSFLLKFSFLLTLPHLVLLNLNLVTVLQVQAAANDVRPLVTECLLLDSLSPRWSVFEILTDYRLHNKDGFKHCDFHGGQLNVTAILSRSFQKSGGNIYYGT